MPGHVIESQCIKGSFSNLIYAQLLQGFTTVSERRLENTLAFSPENEQQKLSGIVFYNQSIAKGKFEVNSPIDTVAEIVIFNYLNGQPKLYRQLMEKGYRRLSMVFLYPLQEGDSELTAQQINENTQLNILIKIQLFSMMRSVLLQTLAIDDLAQINEFSEQDKEKVIKGYYITMVTTVQKRMAFGMLPEEQNLSQYIATNQLNKSFKFGEMQYGNYTEIGLNAVKEIKTKYNPNINRGDHVNYIGYKTFFCMRFRHRITTEQARLLNPTNQNVVTEADLARAETDAEIDVFDTADESNLILMLEAEDLRLVVIKAITKCITNFTETERKILLYRFSFNLTRKEVEEKLGLSENSCNHKERVTLNRLEVLLKDQLAAEDFELIKTQFSKIKKVKITERVTP